MRQRIARLGPPAVFGTVLVGVWYAISYGLLSPRRRFLLRPPHQVARVGFLDWEHFSEILDGLWSSARVAIIGLVLATLIGIALATLMSLSRVIESAVFPYLVMLQAVPILAVVPLIGFWWGYGQTSRVTVCVLIAVFPIVVNTLFGLQSTDRGLHDLFTLHHASRSVRLRKLLFPGALPALFAGLRISAGLSVIGAIVGDFFFAQGDPGIGQLLRIYAAEPRGEELLAAIIMSSGLGVVVFLAFGRLQTALIGAWHDQA